MRLLFYWVISAVSLVISIYVAQRVFRFDVALDTANPLRVMLGVLLLGLVNATIGTVAKVITAPLNCLSFGIAWLLINAALFYWVGQMDLGFSVGDFWAALVGSLLMGLVLGLLRGFFDRHEKAA